MFETVNWNISRLTLHVIVHRLEFRVKSFEDIFEKHGLLDRVAHWSDDELLEALPFMPVAPGSNATESEPATVEEVNRV